jgi:hypothetical protein
MPVIVGDLDLVSAAQEDAAVALGRDSVFVVDFKVAEFLFREDVDASVLVAGGVDQDAVDDVP